MTILENLNKIGHPLESMTSSSVGSSFGSDSTESVNGTADSDWRGGGNWRGSGGGGNWRGGGGNWNGGGGNWRGGGGGGHWRGGGGGGNWC
ncbi:hypothetical protein PPL_02926 [Heterostelium album PN500]|uniref:Uncharacterized protein n=1 Tax=Heterostelium pallidum (strain ATCC 26659 / Pp 5 / PN500) TaxID=670386 RepID=D3B3F8_HETP5|nr:hypothetical protein PPL_02926 [Heterostelium album PN500]EFA83856.1 hypothetical protein PPL_02926 [Heterostelium album PN500]|eukprot:XP_020435973.1 hypothetical protein PPL_02926 [Heterostelium album PN500]